MKRAAIALGIVAILAILASSCGASQLSPRLATTLENRVTSIRGYAESGQPGMARSALRNLVELVTAQTEAGRIDEGRAAEILAASQAVAEQLTLLPRTAPTESPSPSPVDEGGDGGNGNGNGNDKDKGHGDEDHGNDD